MSSVVPGIEHSTHNPKVEGSNPATGTGRDKKFPNVFFSFLQCGNYGIGGHYWTHPDYHHPSPEHWLNPRSVGNRVATILTILDAPSAGTYRAA
jgi:hypothetical protein